MEQAEVSIFPGSPPKWAIGIELVESIRIGDGKAREIDSQMDLPTALHIAVSINSGLLFELDNTGVLFAEQAIQQLAKWLAGGAPPASPGWEPPVPF